MAYVVSISGPPGSGKTSLMTALEARLGDVACIEFDRYERLTDQPLGEIIEWMNAGADIDKLSIPGLGSDLAALKRGEQVAVPSTQEVIEPASTILFETQFGRRHNDSGQYIDLSLWIDVPLDIALARKVKQITTELSRAENHEAIRHHAGWLLGYLDMYESGTRTLLRMQREQVRTSADVFIDGMAGLLDMTEHAERVIIEKRSKQD